MTDTEKREHMPGALRGAAALWEMLNMIGEEGKDDHDLARIFCDAEMDIRSLVAFVPSVLEWTP